MKKTKVIVTHPKEWATADYAADSSLQIIHVSMGGKTPKKVSGIVTHDGYAEVVTQEAIKELKAAFQKHKPDYFLFWLHKGVSPSLIAALKKISPKTKFIIWYGNHRLKLPKGVRVYLPYLHAVCINSQDERQYDMYRSVVKHVFTLYDGFAPSESPLVEFQPEYDCFFGGNSYIIAAGKRPGLLFPGAHIRYEFITKAHKLFKTMVCSDAATGWPFKVHPGVYHPKYTQVMRKAKITLNVNHFPSFYKAYTRRTIRSIFARRCHITLYIPGMEDDFENHKHLVWFKSVDEGLDQIKYYLDHEKEREEIAWAGWRLAMEKFTFENRFRDFEKSIGGLS